MYNLWFNQNHRSYLYLLICFLVKVCATNGLITLICGYQRAFFGGATMTVCDRTVHLHFIEPFANINICTPTVYRAWTVLFTVFYPSLQTYLIIVFSYIFPLCTCHCTLPSTNCCIICIWYITTSLILIRIIWLLLLYFQNREATTSSLF